MTEDLLSQAKVGGINWTMISETVAQGSTRRWHIGFVSFLPFVKPEKHQCRRAQGGHLALILLIFFFLQPIFLDYLFAASRALGAWGGTGLELMFCPHGV